MTPTRAVLVGASDAELDRFGFTVLDLLEPAEMDALSESFASFGPAPDDPRSAIHFGFFSTDQRWKAEVDAEIRRIVGPALDRCFSGHECYFAMTIVKWPGGRGSFSAHQDPSYVDERIHRTLTVWCPLVATQHSGGVENGRLHLVPGSHLLGPDVRVNDTSEFAFEASRDDIASRLGVAVPTTPGQAVVFDNRTIHYSYPNHSEVPRAVVAVGLRPRGARSLHFARNRHDPACVDVFDLPDDHFVRTDPLRLGVLGAEAEPIASLRLPVPSVDPAALRAAVDAAGRPDVSVEPDRSISAGGEAYCFVCGSTESLVGVSDPERAGMATCSACIATLLEPDGAASDQLTASVQPAAERPGSLVSRLRRWAFIRRKGGISE